MSDSPGIAAVILAAGASTRLGRSKQSVVLGGETLLHRAVCVAAGAGLSPVIAVVADRRLIPPLEALGATAILNREAYAGIASSIHTGIAWAQAIAARGAVILTCDQVAVSPEHLRALCDDPVTVTGSAYSGGIGVPAYFPASHFPALLALEGDTGARSLLKAASSITLEALALDVDTEEDLARASEFLNSHESCP